MASYSASLSEFGAIGGIVRIVARNSLSVRSVQTKLKLGPASAGASNDPWKVARWQAEHDLS